MIAFLGWLSAVATLLTVLPMCQDATRVPARHGLSTMVRHYLRLLILVVIAACSGLMIFYPSLRTASAYEVVLRCALACYLAQQTPYPWWHYVFGDAYRKALLDSFRPKVRAR